MGGYGQDLIAEVTTPRKLNNGEVISGSFGLQIGDRGSLKTIRHGGSWTSYRSEFIRFPDRQFSFICSELLGKTSCLYTLYVQIYMQISLNLCEIQKVELSVYIVVVTGYEGSTLVNNK
ncbi:hypothetical protein [Chlorogloeopsis fritschii]|uniref:hypothetical protein n=1 Tax=Chlorogloeopsis fritschii TaxID=1124 RepID=UPI0023F40069|nr:hypothetical protein [Chlorogloeopsis fritschii]